MTAPAAPKVPAAAGFWWVRMPRWLSARDPASGFLASDGYVWGAIPGIGAVLPLLALGFGFYVGGQRPFIVLPFTDWLAFDTSFTESLALIVVLFAVGMVSGQLGAWLVAGFVLGDILIVHSAWTAEVPERYVEETGGLYANPFVAHMVFERVPLLVHYLLLALLVILVPLAIRAIAGSIVSRLRGAKLVDVVVATILLALAAYLAARLWAAAAPQVIRPLYTLVAPWEFSQEPPEEAITPLQEKTDVIARGALVVAVGRAVVLLVAGWIPGWRERIGAMERALTAPLPRLPTLNPARATAGAVVAAIAGTLLVLGLVDVESPQILLVVAGVLFVARLARVGLIPFPTRRFRDVVSKVPLALRFGIGLLVLHSLAAAAIFYFEDPQEESFTFMIWPILAGVVLLTLLMPSRYDQEPVPAPPTPRGPAAAALLVLASLGAAAWVLLATAQPAYAHHCGDYWDCFGSAFSALTALFGSMFVVALSVAIDLSPLGYARGVYEFATGRDLLTGRQLSWAERVIGVIPYGRLARMAGGLTAGIGATRGWGRLGSGFPSVHSRPPPTRSFRGEPVDVATGEVVLPQTDVELAGLLPMVVSRTHISSYRAGGRFGTSWASTLDQRLEVDAGGVGFAAEDGTLLSYPAPAPGESALPRHGPRWPLALTAEGYLLTDPERRRSLLFAAPGPAAAEGGPQVLPLTAVVDRRGHRIEFRYRPDGELAELAHSGGYRITVETRDGLVTALRLADPADPAGGAVLARYGYDQGGRLTEVVNSAGAPLRFDHDDDGRLTGWQDRNGSWYRYAYDPEGRCVRGWGPDRVMDTTFTYQPGTTVVTDSLGHASSYRLNEAGQVVAERDPLGHTTTFEWDPRHRLLARTDPLGQAYRYRYDEAGAMTAILRPDGGEVWVSYREPYLPESVTEPDGAQWRYVYDVQGNLAAVTDPAGAATRYGYDPRGHLATVTDPLGHTHRVETDGAGLPVAVTDPMGAVTRYRRDAFGRVVEMVDPLGGTIRLQWTVDGRLAARTREDGTTEQWRYDAEGNLTGHRDPAGGVRQIEIGHFDTVASRTGPDGARLQFQYDTELRLVAVVNPQGATWRYEYDPAGNLVGETDFNGREVRYGYDAAGQLVTRADAAGRATRLTRDPAGRVVERRTGDTVANFGYDQAGRLVRAVSDGAELTLGRDPVGRVLAETCNGRTVAFRYDAAGRRVWRRTPGGVETTWEHDPNGRPATLHLAGRSVQFHRDAAGREVERRTGGGLALAQTWDANHRLLAQTLLTGGADPGAGAGSARLVQRRGYRYREDGQLVGVTDQLAGDRQLELDAAGRVTAVHGANWTERYAYDAAGTPVHATWPGDEPAEGEREYAGTLVRRAGNVRFEYDDRGRVTLRQQKRHSTKPRTWRYTWDDEDRLVGVVTPEGERWAYRYHALGRRIAKQRLAPDGDRVHEQVDFAWDGPLLAEQTHDGRATVWEWEPGSFHPVGQVELPAPGPAGVREAPQEWVDARFYAIVTDLVGAPAELVAEDGEVVWQARATLWGRTRPAEDGGVDCPLRYPGQYHDPETGLHYNYHRYYDPDTARYASPDPLGLLAGPDPHAYVDNPTAAVDPLGLIPCGPGGRLELPPGRPARLDRNALEPHEAAQAQRIVDFRGGHFVGNTQRGAPGIDGTLDGVPASLKRYTGSSAGGVLRHASRAESQAARAGYNGVELYIDAPQVSRAQLLDFAPQGGLVDIPRQGTIDAIYVRTADGWVVIPG